MPTTTKSRVGELILIHRDMIASAPFESTALAIIRVERETKTLLICTVIQHSPASSPKKERRLPINTPPTPAGDVERAEALFAHQRAERFRRDAERAALESDLRYQLEQSTGGTIEYSGGLKRLTLEQLQTLDGWMKSETP